MLPHVSNIFPRPSPVDRPVDQRVLGRITKHDNWWLIFCIIFQYLSFRLKHLKKKLLRLIMFASNKINTLYIFCISIVTTVALFNTGLKVGYCDVMTAIYVIFCFPGTFIPLCMCGSTIYLCPGELKAKLWTQF